MKRFIITILTPWKSPISVLLLAVIYFMGISKGITGDLGRIGQIVFSKQYRLQNKFMQDDEDLLPLCGIDELKDLDIVFFGDSFTEFCCYPSYLSKSTNSRSAICLDSTWKSPEEIFVLICNNNINIPPIVVLESVERSFVERLVDLDFNTNEIAQARSSRLDFGKQTDLLTFYKNKFENNHSVCHLSIDAPLFTCSRKQTDLYFYEEDLHFPTDEQIRIATFKLDTLFQLANEKHIQLFYVVAADKYDVYQDFAVDNPYSRKTVLDSFIKFENNPFFVNTRPLLYTKAKEGVSDLYYADDTHWSPVGAKLVAEEIARRMDSLGVFRK